MASTGNLEEPKTSSILGPLMFGFISLATGSQRFAMAALILFFILGGVVLNQVKPIVQPLNQKEQVTTSVK